MKRDCILADRWQTKNSNCSTIIFGEEAKPGEDGQNRRKSRSRAKRGYVRMRGTVEYLTLGSKEVIEKALENIGEILLVIYYRIRKS